jgi:hypothetical protein
MPKAEFVVMVIRALWHPIVSQHTPSSPITSSRGVQSLTFSLTCMDKGALFYPPVYYTDASAI